jgi:hypothetical protein
MYHTLAHPKTIDLVERDPSVKQLARELCHKFNLFVMSHDDELSSMGNNHPRVMLTKNNGMPFCVIRTENAQDQAGKPATKYIITSPIIRKDKGRGADRQSRESINLRALLKNIEKDWSMNHDAMDIEQRIDDINLIRKIESAAERELKVGWSDSVSISGNAVVAVFQYLFENKPIPEESKNIIENKFKQYLKEVDTRAKVNEVINRFLTDCLVLIKHNHCPALVAKVSMKLDENNKVKVKVHDEVKCYSDESTLSADYPELTVAIKMFNTKNQLNSTANDDLYPIKSILINSDKLDIDLDVFTSDSSRSGYLCVSRYNLFLTPAAKHE